MGNKFLRSISIIIVSVFVCRHAALTGEDFLRPAAYADRKTPFKYGVTGILDQPEHYTELLFDLNREDFASLRRNGGFLKRLYKRLSPGSKRVLLDPNMMSVILGSRHIYVRSGRTDLKPFLNEIAAMEKGAPLKFVVTNHFMIETNYFLFRLQGEGRLLIDMGIMGQDEVLFLLSGPMDVSKDRLIAKLAEDSSTNPIKNMAVLAFMMGYPIRCVQALANTAGTPTPLAVTITRYCIEQIPIPSEFFNDINFAVKTWDAMLDYGYALLSIEPDFDKMMPKGARMAFSARVSAAAPFARFLSGLHGHSASAAGSAVLRPISARERQDDGKTAAGDSDRRNQAPQFSNFRAHVNFLRYQAHDTNDLELRRKFRIEALALCDAELLRNPDDIYVRKERAETLRVLMRYEEAVEEFSRVLKHSPNDRNALNGLGYCFMEMAVKCYPEVIMKFGPDQRSDSMERIIATKLIGNQSYREIVEFIDGATRNFLKVIELAGTSKKPSQVSRAYSGLAYAKFENADLFNQLANKARDKHCVKAERALLERVVVLCNESITFGGRARKSLKEMIKRGNDHIPGLTKPERTLIRARILKAEAQKKLRNRVGIRTVAPDPKSVLAAQTGVLRPVSAKVRLR